MDEYRYPKSGYSYHAIKLIYGEKSPHLEHFSVYGLPPHSEHHIHYIERGQRRASERGPGINETCRYVNLDGVRTLHTHKTESTGINTALTYQHMRLHQESGKPQIDVITDVMFSQTEYEYFCFNWDDQVQYKVDILARLIRALDIGDVKAFAMFIEDFPEIAKYLVSGKPSFEERPTVWKHE